MSFMKHVKCKLLKVKIHNRITITQQKVVVFWEHFLERISCSTWSGFLTLVFREELGWDDHGDLISGYCKNMLANNCFLECSGFLRSVFRHRRIIKITLLNCRRRSGYAQNIDSLMKM